MAKGWGVVDTFDAHLSHSLLRPRAPCLALITSRLALPRALYLLGLVLQPCSVLACFLGAMVPYAATERQVLEGLMSGEEGQGFVIRDRRGRTEPGEESFKEQEPSTAAPGSHPGESHGQAPPADQPGPPVSFSSFVFSLGTSALMLMGEQLDPQQPKPPMNLSQAKEIIDILSLLEEKTRGNLASDEQAVLRDMLYALRMKYVDLASGKKAAASS